MQRLYKKIIIICLESVCLRMLPFYNKNLPIEAMPFLSTLFDGYPRLDNFYTSQPPTNFGMHALFSSRLAYEYDMRHGMGRTDSLVSLLGEAGYKTFFLSGVTQHYYDKELFCKSLLRFEHCFSEETVRALYADPLTLQWGIADSVMYDLALKVLDSCRDDPVLLTFHTLNTHPPFYHSLAEEAFPEEVRASSSRVLRSLFEVDRDIMTFFKGLGQRKLFDDDTLIIITSDHSPTFCPEYLELVQGNDYTLEPIPCVFVSARKEPSPFAALNPANQCCQLDFLPTLVDALGLRRPAHVMGRSLFCGQDTPFIGQYGHDLWIRTKHASCAVNIEPGTDLGEAEFLRKWYNNVLLEPYTARP